MYAELHATPLLAAFALAALVLLALPGSLVLAVACARRARRRRVGVAAVGWLLGTAAVWLSWLLGYALLKVLIGPEVNQLYGLLGYLAAWIAAWAVLPGRRSSAS